MNLIDVLIVGFILLGALQGYQRGLVTGIINFLSSIVGFLIASMEYMTVLRWAEQHFPLQQWLEPVIYRMILPAIQSKASSLQQQVLGNILGALPPEWRSIFSSANLPGAQIPQGSLEQVAHRLSGVLTDHILSLLAFGFVFYCVVFIVQIAGSILLRPFGAMGGAFNRGGGFLFGGLSALIGLAVLAGLFSPVLKLGVGGSFNALVQSSSFYPYLVSIFQALDHAFSAQITQKLLEPLSLDKGIWF